MPVSTVLINSQPILVEVEDRHIPLVPVDEGQLEGLTETIERVTDLGSFIRNACTQLYSSVKEAADAIKPAEIEMTFGVKLGGEAGIPFVAKGTAEANVAVTLTWKPGEQLAATGEGGQNV